MLVNKIKYVHNSGLVKLRQTGNELNINNTKVVCKIIHMERRKIYSQPLISLCYIVTVETINSLCDFMR